MSQPLLTLTTVLATLCLIATLMLQARAFLTTRRKATQLAATFTTQSSWNVYRNSQRLVTGIMGQGNTLFNSIVSAINDRLGTKGAATADYDTLRNDVEHKCNDAADQLGATVSWPLIYALLAAVVIVNIVLLTPSPAPRPDALRAAAAAIVAAAAGAMLTAAANHESTKARTQLERGKRDFLVWIRANIMPGMPTTTADTLATLSRNVARLNATLATSAMQLHETMEKTAQFYDTQQQIIGKLQNLDTLKASAANMEVLGKLEACTDRLQQFNDYLDAVRGYTQQIEAFRAQLAQEQMRLNTLEEIRDFFKNNGYRTALAKAVTDSDNALREALTKLQQAAAEGTQQLTRSLTAQTDTFGQTAREMQTAFAQQLEQTPQIEQQLEQIAALPKQLAQLVRQVENSNAQLATNIATALHAATYDNAQHPATTTPAHLPRWLFWLIAINTLLAAMPYLQTLMQQLTRTTE